MSHPKLFAWFAKLVVLKNPWGLKSAGILKKENLSSVFPHKTSHWIGRFVHDACPYAYDNNSPIELAAGMTFTVEPALYFKSKDSKYNGIGVRIEDVVLVTETGCEILSHVPKEIDEIEEIRAFSFGHKRRA